MRRLLAAAVLAGELLSARAFAQPVPEYELKAAYLYNFALLVEWPSGAMTGGEIAICVIGRDPFGAALAAIDGKPAHERRVSVRRVATLREARACQVLYISASEQPRSAQIHAALRGMPVLTVAEAEASGEPAAIVTLSRRDSRVSFAIDLAAAKQAQLRISSRLLRLASEVVGE